MRNLRDLQDVHSTLKISIEEDAIKFLKSITQREREMIYKKISHHLDDVDNIPPLIGKLKGFYKIKMADIRIILQKEQKNVINIYLIGRRDDIYELLMRKK